MKSSDPAILLELLNQRLRHAPPSAHLAFSQHSAELSSYIFLRTMLQTKHHRQTKGSCC